MFYADRSASLGEGRHVFRPRVLVEVNGEKPTGLVFEERAGAYYVSPL
ncbi:MAG: hypothetical protein WA446_08400 [Steroidobacteraceae bacterium]